jgi:hypothetical protein
MRKPRQISAILFAIILIVGFQVCFGDSPAAAPGSHPSGPHISITKSNENVIVTWPHTFDSWHILRLTAFGYVVSNSVSNGFTNSIIHRATTEPVSQASYLTNGTNILVILPLDSTNRFFLLRTNRNFALPPIPQF